ncbi:hypothetical protein CH293_03005 [Rhodococcus sp. 14-2470-1b]|uniref:glycosyltransferase n=1 Tax=Rhodococcus sp. 14-2470-1b TaxID=2023149 RepID=UPI000B9B340F|nr:glycosyltransferase [Rhodococcus sp. 14-2470-1b]OZF57694.1 hypothetical protein CH293_03005 [Rhodococcus sp. 14-2470-1b]
MTAAHRSDEDAEYSNGHDPTNAAPAAGTASDRVDRIVTVVPAHNESALLPVCLGALVRARAQAPVPVDIVVVLDACTDDSAHHIPTGVSVVHIDRGNVGAARAAGFDYGGRGRGTATWFACTDADSRVPHTSFTELVAAHSGRQALAGTVDVPTWREHSTALANRYTDRYRTPPGENHGHIHGANMAVRADMYWDVGGFRALATGEDVDLMTRVVAAGGVVGWLDTWTVATSDRRMGRAPAGFAAHLADLEADEHLARGTRGTLRRSRSTA